MSIAALPKLPPCPDLSDESKVVGLWYVVFQNVVVDGPFESLYDCMFHEQVSIGAGATFSLFYHDIGDPVF